MIHSDILNTLKKKKLSDKEKLELIKKDIDENPDIINQTSTEKKFEYQSIVGLSLLYAPAVFDYIKEKNYKIDFSQTTKTNEHLLHVISRSKNIALYFEEILTHTENFINVKDTSGISPLFHLFSQIEDRSQVLLMGRDFMYIDTLINKGATLDFPLDNKHPFNMALVSNNYKIMSYLVEHGFDPNIMIKDIPLILKINPSFDFRSPSYYDLAENKIELLNFLSDSGYDFTILNEQQWLVEFLKGINYFDDKKLEDISLFLKNRGVNFNINHEGILELYERFTYRHTQVEVLKIFDNLGIDYTKTENHKNILSYFFTAPYKEKESINALNYLEGKNIHIDFDIYQFKDGMHYKNSFIGKIIRDYCKNAKDFIKIINYIGKNINADEKPSITLELLTHNTGVQSKEICDALDAFMQKVEIKSWNEINSTKYLLSPLQQTYFKNNKKAEQEFMGELVKNLYDKTYNMKATFDMNRSETEKLFIQNLQENYQNSLLKVYLDYHCKREERYNFVNLMLSKNIYMSKSNLSDIFENFLNSTLEKNYLNNSLNEKAEPTIKINRL